MKKLICMLTFIIYTFFCSMTYCEDYAPLGIAAQSSSSQAEESSFSWAIGVGSLIVLGLIVGFITANTGEKTKT